MTWLTDIITSYRDHGLQVADGAPGWESFGVGDWTYGKPVATLKHHFVISYSSPDSNGVTMLRNGYNTGSYFLKPPVVNTYLGKSGIVYPIAGRVAQHGGTGVRATLVRAMNDQPCTGRASVTDDFDGPSFAYWGTETHNPGDGTPMPDEQLEALIQMGVAECQAMGWSANRVIMHLESTMRKNDVHPAAVTGSALRAQIAARLAGGPAGNTDMDWTDIVATATQAQLDLLLKGAQAAIDLKVSAEQASAPGTLNAFMNLQTTNAAVSRIESVVVPPK